MCPNVSVSENPGSVPAYWLDCGSFRVTTAAATIKGTSGAKSLKRRTPAEFIAVDFVGAASRFLGIVQRTHAGRQFTVWKPSPMDQHTPKSDVTKLADTWNKLGEKDAMWAIYTADPTKLGGHWKAEDFFETGRVEIAAVVAGLEKLGKRPPFRNVLDFGCGVGRLSRALSGCAEHVVSLDIAPSMIEQGRQLHADFPKIEWRLNQQEDLRLFGDATFDLIYTNVVLQHMPTRMARLYISEFFRVVEPGGWVVFQLPNNEVLTPKRAFENFVYNEIVPRLPASLLLNMRKRRYSSASEETLKDLPFMQMYGMKRRDVVAYVERLGGVVDAAVIGNDAGAGWESVLYFARKL
jgi:ubiquinone/menaquinone biosynthesis C-methylase UbiE